MKIAVTNLDDLKLLHHASDMRREMNAKIQAFNDELERNGMWDLRLSEVDFNNWNDKYEYDESKDQWLASDQDC